MATTKNTNTPPTAEEVREQEYRREELRIRQEAQQLDEREWALNREKRNHEARRADNQMNGEQKMVLGIVIAVAGGIALVVSTLALGLSPAATAQQAQDTEFKIACVKAGGQYLDYECVR